MMRQALGALVLSMFAAGGVVHAATPAPAPATAQIVVSHFMFQPMALTVAVGTTVTWVNKDDEAHTVRSDTGAFASAALDTDESYSFRFDQPGTYHFTCSLHTRMVGTIIVQ
jgi:plastocyanin